MAEKQFAPVTPGEMLKDEFLAEYRLSQNQLARAIGISPNRIAEIVNDRRRITADTALRLGLYAGNGPRAPGIGCGAGRPIQLPLPADEPIHAAVVFVV